MLPILRYTRNWGLKRAEGHLQKGRIFGSFRYLQSLNPITAIWVLIYSQLYRSIDQRVMNVTSNPPLKIHAHGDMMPFRVLCAIRTWLSNHWWFHCMLLFVQLLASRSLSRCIATWHGSSFVVKSGNTQKVPTILFGRVLRCPPMGALSWDYGTYIWCIN